MAKRQEDTTGPKKKLNRRSYLQLTGVAAAAAATTFGGALSMKSVAAQPSTVVDLGEQGLSNGDEIDSYLEEYVDNGVEVRVPAGEYDWNGDGFTGADSDAAIVGQGEVILNNVAGDYYQTIEASGGTVEIRNFTIRGQATGSNSRFRLQTDSSGHIVIDNVNFPDGGESGAESKAFYVPREHSGVVEIRNCYYANFDDNGIYASSPGYDDGGGGQVIIENCTSHNNNIAGFRIGSSNSVIRNCLVLNDGPSPRSPGGSRNMRGIRVRAPGDDILIEDTEIIHSYDGAGSPIQLHETAEGGSGTIRNVRILNNSDSTAIADQGGNTAENWTGTNISITGDGDLSYPSNFDVETGSGAEEPTGDDPSQSGSGDDGSNDDGSSGDDGSNDDSGTGGDAPADGAKRLLIRAPDSGGCTYSFTATENVTGLWDLERDKADRPDPNSIGEAVKENDDGTWTGTGALSGGGSSGDTFTYQGDLIDFTIEGDVDAVRVYVDGTEVEPEDLVVDQPDDGTGDDDSQADDGNDGGDGATDELTNVLIIDGTATPEIAQYRVTVSGTIERSDSLSSVVDGGSPWDKIEDRLNESTVTGVVGKGMDGYRFSGELTDFQVKGNVNVTLEQDTQ